MDRDCRLIGWLLLFGRCDEHIVQDTEGEQRCFDRQNSRTKSLIGNYTAHFPCVCLQYARVTCRKIVLFYARKTHLLKHGEYSTQKSWPDMQVFLSCRPFRLNGRAIKKCKHFF